MTRTTAAAVKLVMLRDYDADPEVGSAPDLSPYIETASAVVDDIVAYVAANALTALSAARLELIERWLSAHYYQQSDKGYTSKSTEGASGSFQGQTGKGLNSTFYGQSAISLDSSGFLQGLAAAQEGNSGARSAGASWLGTTEPNQLTYTERN